MFYSVIGVWREAGPELTQWLKTSSGTQVLFIVLLHTFTFHAGPHGPRMAAAVPWIKVTRAGRGAENTEVVAALFFHQRRTQKPQQPSFYAPSVVTSSCQWGSERKQLVKEGCTCSDSAGVHGVGLLSAGRPATAEQVHAAWPTALQLYISFPVLESQDPEALWGFERSSHLSKQWQVMPGMLEEWEVFIKLLKQADTIKTLFLTILTSLSSLESLEWNSLPQREADSDFWEKPVPT